MSNEIIEKVKATFLDDTYIIPQDETIYRLDQHGDRNYFKIDENGNPVVKASTTTIIKKFTAMSPYLLQWWCKNGYDESKALLKESSMLGTFLHILWGKLLLKYNIDLSEAGIKAELYKYFEQENETFNYDFKKWHKKIKKDLIGFVKWVQDYEVEPIAVEMSIIGKDASGTLDLVCRMNFVNKEESLYPKTERIKALIDFKSGENAFYDEYAIQLEGYRDLWNEKFPDEEIKRIFSYGCIEKITKGTKNFYRFEEQTFNPVALRWYAFKALYNQEHPKLELEKRTEISEGIINIESNFESLLVEIDPLNFMEVDNAETQRSQDANNRQD